MEIKIIRSKRRTMSLTVDREGNALVRAPLHAAEAEIRIFVERHKRWLSKRIDERQGGLELCDGGIVSLLGANYTVVEGTRARLADGTLYLPQAGREAALTALLHRITRKRMQSVLDRICASYGFSYTSLKVTSARGRWGSCSSKKSICFTFRTAFLPDALAEYLALHELCHTRYMNHGSKFWQAVGEIMPDYATRRRALKGYLWAMNCL